MDLFLKNKQTKAVSKCWQAFISS